MSKNFPPIGLIFATFVLILQIFTNAQAQGIDVRIKVTTDTQVRADVKVDFAASGDRNVPRDVWFMDEYAGIAGLNERRSVVYIRDKQGYLVARKRFLAGERVNGGNVGGIGYTVDLTPVQQQSAAAHVSWANNEGGVLMMDDLLPQSVGLSAKVKLELPARWKVMTTDVESEPSGFLVSDLEEAVFYIGLNIREQQVQTRNSRLVLSIAGEWLFSDVEAAEMAGSIFDEYRRMYGNPPAAAFRVNIGKFPRTPGIGSWEGGTRGRTVTIISSDMPFRAQSLQRLHEQLRHEIFHLWVPNGVNLSGNYDWFYEGFALYQSLKLGVAIGRIRFDDFLDTLSRAYNIDLSQSQRRSLIEASKSRWAGANTQVYARGMLVGFLCDLALLKSSNGKRSSNIIVREIYRKHGQQQTPQEDGNSAVLSVLRGYSELKPVIDRYITGADDIHWSNLLQAAGIEAETRDQIVKLKLVAKPSGRQKDLLDKLGYNSWRKVSGSN